MKYEKTVKKITEEEISIARSKVFEIKDYYIKFKSMDNKSAMHKLSAELGLGLRSVECLFRNNPISLPISILIDRIHKDIMDNTAFKASNYHIRYIYLGEDISSLKNISNDNTILDNCIMLGNKIVIVAAHPAILDFINNIKDSEILNDKTNDINIINNDNVIIITNTDNPIIDFILNVTKDITMLVNSGVLDSKFNITASVEGVSDKYIEYLKRTLNSNKITIL